MTPYSEVYDSFKDLVIRDVTFFKDHPEEFIEIRLLKLLDHALTNIVLTKDNKDFEINFIELRDDENNTFTEKLNKLEIDIIAYFMWQCYVDEEVVSRLKALKTLGFSDDEIKSYSPAESMKQFNASFERLKSSNIDMLKQYKRIGRDTFRYKRFDYVFE